MYHYYYAPHPSKRSSARAKARGERGKPTTSTATDEPQQATLPTLDAPTLLLLLELVSALAQAETASQALEEDPLIVIESEPIEVEKEATTQQEPVEPSRPRQKKRLPLVLLVLALCSGVAVLLLVAVPLFTASATVTLIPQSQATSATTRFTLVTTSSANPLHDEVPGRLLSALTVSQARTVATTGRGEQPAQAARGLLTFYNALPAVQTIPAGTLLVGADGVQVVSEQDAVLPAAVPPIEGEQSVPAQALMVGPAGNIAAGDISGACCRAGVFVSNRAFTGGQEARTFPMVSQQDRDGAASLLKSELGASAQAAFMAQVRPGETLLVPRCSPQVTSDQRVGEEATHLTVMVSQTCTGEVYDTEALSRLLTQVVTRQAQRQLGTGYTLTGEVEAMVISSTVTNQRTTLQVKGTGTWSYQFDEAHLQAMARLIAGKSREQAIATLLHLPGVSQVGLTVSGGSNTLPRDARAIHVLVLSQAP